MPNQLLPIGIKVRFIGGRLIFPDGPNSQEAIKNIAILEAGGWAGVITANCVFSPTYPYAIRLTNGVRINANRSEFEPLEGQDLYKYTNNLDDFPFEEVEPE